MSPCGLRAGGTPGRSPSSKSPSSSARCFKQLKILIRPVNPGRPSQEARSSLKILAPSSTTKTDEAVVPPVYILSPTVTKIHILRLTITPIVNRDPGAHDEPVPPADQRKRIASNLKRSPRNTSDFDPYQLPAVGASNGNGCCDQSKNRQTKSYPPPSLASGPNRTFFRLFGPTAHFPESSTRTTRRQSSIGSSLASISRFWRRVEPPTTVYRVGFRSPRNLDFETSLCYQPHGPPRQKLLRIGRGGGCGGSR